MLLPPPPAESAAAPSRRHTSEVALLGASPSRPSSGYTFRISRRSRPRALNRPLTSVHMCYPFMCKAGRLHHQWVSDMKSSTLLCQCCVMLEHAINLCRTRTPHELRPLPHNRHRVLYGSIQSRCSTNFTGTPTAGAPPEVVFNWRQISVIVMHGRRARPYCKHVLLQTML